MARTEHGPAAKRLWDRFPDRLFVCLGLGGEPWPGDWNADQPVGATWRPEGTGWRVSYDRNVLWRYDGPWGTFTGVQFLFFTAPGKHWPRLLLKQPFYPDGRALTFSPSMTLTFYVR